jgi:long-chain acyl-CoA synthetase
MGQCKKGILQVRGGTVMKGYYRRDDLTAKVMTKDGWFDTGDLAILTVDNEIQLRGRKKDTIVLQGGENIEPVPIEQKLNTSRYISTAVVFGANEKGEDQRFLAALILLRKDEIEAYAVSSGISEPDYEKLAQRPEIRNLISGEIAELVNAKNGFKSFEKINEFEVITKPFTVGVELSAKQELMRYKIAEIYKAQIAKMFSSDK